MTRTARDPRFEHRVRASFSRQLAMATIGATIERVGLGEVALGLPFRADLTQQHGFLHAGIVTSVLDSACGYAALSLMEPGAAVLSVEFKVNLLAPARGSHFRANGRVVRAGRTVTVVSGELRAFDTAKLRAFDAGVADGDAAGGEDGVLVAIMTGTMMAVRDRAGLID